ncbi:hypothetical protein TNCV_1962631 [Trichonephila clavipes]|nr:hypothetical protein TNCV_1962631 [Trichonephila clavipes]
MPDDPNAAYQGQKAQGAESSLWLQLRSKTRIRYQISEPPNEQAGVDVTKVGTGGISGWETRIWIWISKPNLTLPDIAVMSNNARQCQALRLTPAYGYTVRTYSRN